MANHLIVYGNFRVVHWDVTKEMLRGSYFQDRLNDSSIPIWMFKGARKYDQRAQLFVNDVNIIEKGDSTEVHSHILDRDTQSFTRESYLYNQLRENHIYADK